MKLFALVALVSLACLPGVYGGEAETALDNHLRAALALVGKDEQSLIVPGLQRPAWRSGRLAVVDDALADPLSMQRLSRQSLDVQPGHSMSVYLEGMLKEGGILMRDSTAVKNSSAVPAGDEADRTCNDPG